MDALHPHRHVLHLAEPPVEVAEGQAEDHGAQRGEREAAQSADHRDGVRADHEQGEAGDVEREDGREQDAGQRGKHAADDPARGRRDVGVLTVQACEVAIVDDCPHCDAETGAREQRPQAERDRRRDGEHDEVVPRDRRARDRHHVGLIEPRKRRSHRELVRRPHHRADAEQRDQQADRDDDVRDRRRAAEIPHDDALDHHAHDRRLDEQHRRERERGRPVTLDPQLPIREGRDHCHRTVCEVEDARRGVRDDESARRDEVDAREREAEDRVAPELADHPKPAGSGWYVFVICIELPGLQSKPCVPSVGAFGQ